MPQPRALFPPPAPRRRALNVRSVLLGLVGTTVLSALAFFNDAVVNNTTFIASALPVGLVLVLLVVLLINAPLHRFAPRLAFSGGELAVALAMMLVVCVVPSNGLTRYLIGHLAGTWDQANANDAHRRTLEQLQLPDWLFPTFDDTDVLARGRDPLIRNYLGRAPIDSDRLLDRARAVPWRAWITPVLTWGLFYAAFFGTWFFIAAIVRRQWVENERLPFPLATLYTALIQSPEPGRAANPLFRNRLFWIAFGAVFLVHAVNALAVYYPRHWPEIPLKYNLTTVLNQSPWRYMERRVLANGILFTVVGVTYFVQGRIAFSAWLCLLVWQAPRMAYGTIGKEWTHTESADQSIGAAAIYSVYVLYLGRQQWLVVLRRMFRYVSPLVRPRGMGQAGVALIRPDPQDHYVPYGVAGWGLLVCLATMAAWMRLAGMGWLGILLLVAMFFTLFLALTRIVAETGLYAVMFWTVPTRPWNSLLLEVPALAQGAGPGTASQAALRTSFFTSLFGTLFAVSQREHIAVYSTHALRVVDLQSVDELPERRPGRGLVLAIAGALVLAYVVATGAMLVCEYSYGATLDRTADAPINNWVMTVSAPGSLDHATYLRTHRYPPPPTYSAGGYIALGASITAGLSLLTLWLPWWPIHPLGYVLANALTTYHGWFSIFLGWLAKTLVIRLGGVRLFRIAQPLFIGLVVGECAAAGFWLCVALVRLWLGLEYHPIRLLPG